MNVENGLTSAQAAETLKRDGPNELPAALPKSIFHIAADVLHEPMFLLLLAAGAVYLVLGSVHEAVALAASILVIIGITLYHETKTERTLQALRDLSSPRAMVVRDGEKKRIPGREVVKGDVLVLSEGDRVAADALVIREINLKAEESLLTGESVSVQKAVWDKHSPMPRPGGDHLAAVFSGTLIVKGSGLALVNSTGKFTEVGKLGEALQKTETQKTNLELETASIVRKFTVVSMGLCVIVALAYGLTRGDWLKGALAGLALAISMVPEEFPVVLTIFLALGAWRISRIGVLTRRVPAIEMLGAATVLCVDKTGTLTMNKMEVRHVMEASGHSRSEVLIAASQASGEDPVDPMEKAIHSAAMHAADFRSGRLIREYPLTDGLLVMSRVVDQSGGDAFDVFAKGAPEAIAQLCKIPDGEVLKNALQMAERGMRVLGVASGKVSSSRLPESQKEIRFDYLGLIGLEDPVRPSVPDAVRECHRAGIRVVMITGDFPATARSIAEQIGLNNPQQSVTGRELAAMPDSVLRQSVRDVNVFARILPEQKLGLVEALKANGAIVAMTGDGVNDAPAVKAAHIGIAMGGRGTDVAREAASLVLLNDDFSSIVASIRSGRRIYDNLKRAMTYILAIHVPIAGISLLPVIFKLPLVLLPLHIVFLELVIDPACSIAFESEPEHGGIMSRPPRDPAARLFDRKTVILALLQGLVLFVVTLAGYLVSLYRGQGEFDARAICFTTLLLGNLALIWSNRSRTSTVFGLLRSRNVAMWVITASALVLLAVVLYVPYARELFQFSTLHTDDLAICVGLALAGVTWFEISKLFGRRNHQNRYG